MHPDEEVLTALVLGEEPDPAIRAHVDHCDRCTDLVRRTMKVVAAAGSLTDAPVQLEAPPAHLWNSVLEAVSSPSVTESDPQETPPRATSVEVAPGVNGPRGRPGRAPRARVGALVGFAVGVAATVATFVLVDRSEPASPVVAAPATVAQGQLDPIGQSGTKGSIELLSREGARSVNVRLDLPPPTGDEFVQVWMVDPETNDMISVGIMNTWDGTFEIPDGVNVGAYDLIDLSLEEFDGDPLHSQVSLAQGTFAQTK